MTIKNFEDSSRADVGYKKAGVRKIARQPQKNKHSPSQQLRLKITMQLSRSLETLVIEQRRMG